MTIKKFVTAAADSITEVDPDDVVEIDLDDRIIAFYRPSAAQAAIMMTAGRNPNDAEQVRLFMTLFLELMDEEDARYIEGRLLSRRDPFDLDSEGGLFDMWEHLTESWSGKASKQPADYQKPRRATGKSSTATTRAKASTSSGSRGRASSQ